MDQQKHPVSVPYIVFESEMARLQWLNRRMQILCCIMAAVTALSIAAAALHWI